MVSKSDCLSSSDGGTQACTRSVIDSHTDSDNMSEFARRSGTYPDRNDIPMVKVSSDGHKRFRGDPHSIILQRCRSSSDTSDMQSDIEPACFEEPPGTHLELDNQSSSGGSTHPQTEEFARPMRKGPRKRILKANLKTTTE